MTTLDMDKICTILNDEYKTNAYVEQTGGGCATIYAGNLIPDKGEWGHWEAVAGPGWFNGPGFSDPVADVDDFYIGPDDGGESDDFFRADVTWDEAVAAENIMTIIKRGAA